MKQLFRFDRYTVYALLFFAGIVIVALAGISINTIGIVIIGGVIYFAPSLIARNRRVPNEGSVFVINLFLGWTLIGWVVALAMAARSVPQGTSNA